MLQPISDTMAPQRALRASLFVVACLLLIYWLTGSWSAGGQPDIVFYLLQPLIWTGLGSWAYWLWRRLPNRPGTNRTLVAVAMALGVFYVSTLVIVGVVVGFEETAAGSTLTTLVKDAIYVITLTFGVETARTYLYWTWRGFNDSVAFIGTILLFFAVAVPIGQWDAASDLETLHRVFFGFWIPALTLSGIATWIARFGGMGASFAYRLPILAFVWLVPFTPDVDWPVSMVLGTSVPLMTIPLARSLRQAISDDPRSRHRDQDHHRVWPWTALGGAGMLLVGTMFIAGLFGVRPYVVTGISMEPAMGPGDVAIVDERVEPESLRIDDILKFRQWGLDVVHRIVTIEQGADGLVITTRGDNVARNDPPIELDQIEGRVVLVIPDLGRPALWLRRT